jgi:hypothetical protein
MPDVARIANELAGRINFLSAASSARTFGVMRSSLTNIEGNKALDLLLEVCGRLIRQMMGPEP